MGCQVLTGGAVIGSIGGTIDGLGPMAGDAPGGGINAKGEAAGGIPTCGGLRGRSTGGHWPGSSVPGGGVGPGLVEPYLFHHSMYNS